MPKRRGWKLAAYYVLQRQPTLAPLGAPGEKTLELKQTFLVGCTFLLKKGRRKKEQESVTYIPSKFVCV